MSPVIERPAAKCRSIVDLDVDNDDDGEVGCCFCVGLGFSVADVAKGLAALVPLRSCQQNFTTRKSVVRATFS